MGFLIICKVEEEMYKIATHDSATGEKGWGIGVLFSIFAKTQNKTIQQQIESGCRYFDIRVRKTRRGWVCAHGLWTTKKNVEEILSEINDIGAYCNITYEGWGNSEYEKMVDIWRVKYPKIKIVTVNIKYTEGIKMRWKILYYLHNVEGGAKDMFFKLDFRSWHTLIPIPILWKKIYGPKVVFNDEYYQFVDFL